MINIDVLMETVKVPLFPALTDVFGDSSLDFVRNEHCFCLQINS